jgi:hypothetical protein
MRSLSAPAFAPALGASFGFAAPGPSLAAQGAFGRNRRLNVIVYAIPVFVTLMAAEFGVGLMTGRNVCRLNNAVGS